MASGTESNATFTDTERKNVLAMSYALIEIGQQYREDPTVENSTYAGTFQNFMKAYVNMMNDETSGITSESFAENLLSYEEYWGSPRALQFSNEQEAAGALKAVHRMMSIFGVKTP